MRDYDGCGLHEDETFEGRGLNTCVSCFEVMSLYSTEACVVRDFDSLLFR